MAENNTKPAIILLSYVLFGIILILAGGCYIFFNNDEFVVVKLLPIKEGDTVGNDEVLKSVEILEKRINLEGKTRIKIYKKGKNTLVIKLPGGISRDHFERLLTEKITFELKETKINPKTGETEWITVLDGTKLLKTQAEFDINSNPQIYFELTEEGKVDFAKITAKNINKPLGIFINGKLIDAPVVKEVITSGSGIISGGKLSLEDCYRISAILNAGTLPVRVKIIEKHYNKN